MSDKFLLRSEFAAKRGRLEYVPKFGCIFTELSEFVDHDSDWRGVYVYDEENKNAGAEEV